MRQRFGNGLDAPPDGGASHRQRRNCGHHPPNDCARTGFPDLSAWFDENGRNGILFRHHSFNRLGSLLNLSNEAISAPRNSLDVLAMLVRKGLPQQKNIL
jgi:hypothetical protein